MAKGKEIYHAGNLIHLETGESYELKCFQEYTIGRDDNQGPFHISIDRGAVSRIHAVLSHNSGGLYLVDKGSKNGTTLNNKILEKELPYPIQTNDRLCLADVEFIVQLNEKKENLIKIQSIYGKIEEVGGNRRFSIQSDESGILFFEKRMIELNDCPFILPINFLVLEGQEEMFFDFTGFVPINQYAAMPVNKIDVKKASYKGDTIKENLTDETPVVGVIELLTTILSHLKGCEDYLLASDRIPLFVDTIFVNEQKNKVAFAYIPSVAGSHSLQSKIISLIDEFVVLYNNQEVYNQLKYLQESIIHNNLGLDGIISALGLMEREISYSLWTRKGLAREGQDLRDVNSLFQEEEKGREKPAIQIKIPESLGGKQKKIFISQLLVILILAAVYLSGLLQQMDFVGFLIIVVGIDIWLLRAWKNSYG